MLTKQIAGRLLGVLLVCILGMTGVAGALEVGEQAPDFSLPSTTGETIRLSRFHGKQLVLVEFYIGGPHPT